MEIDVQKNLIKQKMKANQVFICINPIGRQMGFIDPKDIQINGYPLSFILEKAQRVDLLENEVATLKQQVRKISRAVARLYKEE